MSFLSWKNVLNFYIYHTKDNEDFLKKIKHIPLTNYDDSNYIISSNNIVLNNDMKESQNQIDELTNFYKQNRLVTARMGCVEDSFLIDKLFNFKINSHLLINESNEIDKYMKSNAGLYYKNKNDKNKVLDWWCSQTKELLINDTTILTSAYCFLNFEIILWAKLNIKKTFYNYCYITEILLRNSDNKRILYIGNGVESIKKGYERGLQNVWKFPVSNFLMYYLKTPQTTLGMDYPHNSMIETCEEIVKEVNHKYNDFDTAIFSCGAYAAPLINILRKQYPNKNLVYLGSDCFKMFGIYSKLMPYTYFSDAIIENWIEVVEELPKGCINHPEKKYWR
jgi:hypothetical protein